MESQIKAEPKTLDWTERNTEGLKDVYWSGASSLVSSSGPSSPNNPSVFSDLTNLRTNIGDALVNLTKDKCNYLGNVSGNSGLVSIFPQIAGLVEDLGNVGILLDSNDGVEEQYPHSPEIDFSHLCKTGESEAIDAEVCILSQTTGGPDSGELTPVSFSSEFEYHHISDLDFGRQTSIKLPVFSSDQPASPITKETDSDALSAEIKKKFNGKLNRLEMEEEDEGDKTITTFSTSPRESIVGFFTEEYSLDDKKVNESKNPASVKKEEYRENYT